MTARTLIRTDQVVTVNGAELVERHALRITEVAELLAMSHHHIARHVDDLAQYGCTPIRFGRSRVFPALPIARAVDGPDAPPPIIGIPLVCTIPAAARLLGVDADRDVWTSIDSGLIPTFRLGRTVRISCRALAALMGHDITGAA